MSKQLQEVLKRDIPWETYMTAKLISSRGLQLLRRYDHRPENVQASLLEENGVAYVQVFVGILREISKQDTVEYVLALIDEMLSANPKRARLFHDKSLENEDVYGTFIRLLSRRNWFIQETSCKILTLIISARPSDEYQPSVANGTGKQPVSEFDKTLGDLVQWLGAELRHPDHETRATPTAVSSLATLLRERKVRSLFVQTGGIEPLADLISPAPNQQYIQVGLVSLPPSSFKFLLVHL
jgi:V-type H+-transporting ATPase subunit H